MEEKVLTIKQTYLAENKATLPQFIEVLTEFNDNLVNIVKVIARTEQQNCKEQLIALQQYKLESNAEQQTEKRQKLNDNLDNCIKEQAKVTKTFILPFLALPKFYDDEMTKIFKDCSVQTNSVELGVKCVNEKSRKLERYCISRIVSFHDQLNKL